MKTVSRQYKKSMASTFREQSHCIITFGNTDITAITDGSWSGVTNQYSSFSTLDFDHEYGNTIGFLELNRWKLDGKTNITKANDGYIASQYMVYQSGGGGTLYPQTVIKTFTNTHSFNGITITFDTRENEWPFKVKLAYYNGVYETGIETDTAQPIVDENDVPISAFTSQGGTGLIASTIAYPTSNVCGIELQGSNVNLVEITFYSTLPSRRPRIEHITWGVSTVFNDNKILSVTQAHDVDPISRRLPSEKLEFTVEDYDHAYDPDNPGGVYAYITKGSPVSISYGYDVNETTEWVKSDKYSLSDMPVFKNNRVTFKCNGLIGTLTDYYYKGVYNANGRSFYNLAEDVLQDAGLQSSSWDIDNSLTNMTTTAVLPIDTHANLLQLIAHATRCRLFTDDDNIIHLKPFGVSPVGIFNGAYSDNGHIDNSEWDSVDYGTENASTLAALELNNWKLDGSSVVNLANGGYIGSPISDSNGSSSTYWQKEFDVSHDLPLLSITFDEIGHTWPFKVVAEYYGTNGLIGTNTVYPTGTSVTINTDNIDDCTRIKVSCSSLLPYSRPRVTKVAFRETDFSISLDSCKENSMEISKIEKLKTINVTEYKYTAASDTSTLYEADTDLTTLHVEYGLATNISVTVTGGTVTSQNVYSRAADIVMSTGTKHIVITGKQIEESTIVHSSTVGQSGNDDVEENMLITNNSMASSLLTHISSYLQLRNTYDLSYRGNPELEVGDIIELETLYSRIVYGLMLTDEISYNGALSGRVKVKGLC